MNTFFLLLGALTRKVRAAFLRFPLSMMVILVAFGLMVYRTWGVEFFDLPPWVERVTLILWVVLPLFTAPALFFKKNKWVWVPGVLFGLLLFLTTSDFLPIQDIILLGLCGLSFYSFMFVLPRWKSNENTGFWKYCEKILYLLILGFVCSAILLVSLHLALESIRQLFDLTVNYRWDETVNLFSIAFVFPLFVHVGLPDDWEDLNKNHQYAAFFKAISFYLLMPIAGLYFTILGLYIFRILFTQTWPSGQVAYPIVFLTLAVFGMSLVSYPWRKAWQRWIFVALLPFLVIYFVAMGMRIDQYGLTDARYAGILLGLCLMAITLYFIFVRRQRLQMFVLPITAASLLFAVGPWSVHSLPLHLQEKRLENMLLELGALQDGQLQKVDETQVPVEIQRQISSILYYLSDRDALDDVQAWMILDSNEPSVFSEATFMQAMGLELRSLYPDPDDGLEHFFYGIQPEQSLMITSFEQLARFDISYNTNYLNDNKRVLTFDDDRSLELTLTEKGLFTVQYRHQLLSLEPLLLHGNLKSNAQDKGTYEPSQLMLEGENADLKVRLYFETLNGALEEDTQNVESLYLTGVLLVHFKR